MKRRSKVRILSFVLAGAAALGLSHAADRSALDGYRLAARYSAGHAFEETVSSVDALAQALQKSLYATGGSMCARLCSEAFARAEAAESSLSVLPFATQELEQLSGFLNLAGDYAYSLVSAGTEQGFSEEQRQQLQSLSDAAADFAGQLRQLQGSLNRGELRLDSRETPLVNVLPEDETPPLSAGLLACEEDFTPPEPFAYDGRYGCREEKKARGSLTESEMQALAADFAGVEPEELKLAYQYEGTEGRRCYRAGDLYLCVSRAGVESLSQTRLVPEAKLSLEEARQIAEDFLREKGYEDLSLGSLGSSANLALMRFDRTEGDVQCLDNFIALAVALDDGSLYQFSAADYCPDPIRAVWTVDEEQARAALPEALAESESRKVLIKSPGGRDLACYAFRGQGAEGRELTVYVDAATGEQCRIEF